MIHFLFQGRAAPACLKSAGADDSAVVDLTDAIAILQHLFLGKPALAPPAASCGLDPTPDPLDCAQFQSCP